MALLDGVNLKRRDFFLSYLFIYLFLEVGERGGEEAHFKLDRDVGAIIY